MMIYLKKIRFKINNKIIPIFFSDKYFVCSICKDYYMIKFHNYKYMDLECKCRLLRNFTLDDLEVSYFSEYKAIFCEKNKDQNENNKKFVQYCKDCKIDLCEDCLKEKEKYKNDTGKITVHEVHDLINLSINENEFDEYETNNNDPDDIKNLKGIIFKLLKKYEEYPSYKGYKSLMNAKKILENPVNPESKQLLQIKILKKINSIK